LRKYLAAALAVPVLLLIYAGAIVRRPSSRIPIALVVIGMVSMLATTAARPNPASGIAPTHGSAVAASEFSTAIETGESAHAAIAVSFPSPMNGASVEANLSVDPATAINLAWDATETHLTVTPRSAWAIGTLHTITVDAGALDAKGSPLEHRVRAAFLTRGPTTAALTAAPLAAGEATGATRFRIAFNGPIDATSIALQFSPALAGQLVSVAGSTDLAPVLEFIPSNGLAANVTYQVSLSATARDLDGFAIVSAPATIRMAAAPAVIRFRPLTGAKGVGWTQNLSVRFSEPMDHATTQAAWSATQAGLAIAGSFSWAENDKVLVFNPTSSLGYAQKISLAVASSATSRAGLQLKAAATATFTTAAKPSTGTHRTSGGSSGGSGGSIGGSTWAAVEAYYLKLMNCTRTGGWVTSTGACSSPGGRAVRALWQDAGITAKVSRPYARKLAVYNICSHFSGGTPATRLRAAGYSSYIWAENLGCRSGNPYSAVLGSHLFFQSEKSYSGGHYVNLMNAKYDRVGIGVWVAGGRVRLVVDFYHPL
jgi:uncharacterized protein YkwD